MAYIGDIIASIVKKWKKSKKLQVYQLANQSLHISISVLLLGALLD
jgi:hypothetical protein